QGNLVLRDEGQLAAHHARLAMNAMRGIGSQVHLVMWNFVGSIALIAGGEYSTADAWLDEGWELSSGTYLEGFRAAYLMVRAASALRQGEKARCRELMKRSLELARTGNGSYYYRWVLRFREPLMAQAIEAGIDVPYVTALVRNFDFRPPDPVMEAWPWSVRITTLGNFGVEVDGSPLAFSRKAPKKPLALLKAVIAFGGRKVPEKRLLDALWPDEDGDAATEAFRVAIHRLRKLLGDVELVEVDSGAVSLNLSHCWIDARAFEHAVESAADAKTDSFSANADRVLQLYKGHFLPADEESPWAISPRERLRSKFVAYVARQGKRLEASARHDLAAEYYRRGIEADELAEEFYQGLMRCHLQAGGVSDAMNVYRRLRQTLSVTLGIHPSPASQKLFQSLRQ
ncbi:MAG TPA: BTAD domain-containing putative transcriptional regulator, partial [Burkholderiales bacterium]|nr:BTAD domain-containing putative transcriptional regulator [Burkholderiales bacterium]